MSSEYADYWNSLVVRNLEGRPVRKVTFDEALAQHPLKNPHTLDRDIRRAWAKLSDKEPDPRFRAKKPISDSRDIKWHKGSLSLNARDVTSYVILFDMHYPYQVHQDAIMAFLKDFQPDKLIYGGDTLNNDPFNHWAENTPRESRNMPLPRPYYDDANRDLFHPFARALKAHTETVFMKGNHEAWADRAIDDDPRGEGFWETELNIGGVDTWVQSRELISLGKLHVAHGDIIQGANINPARNIFLKGFHRNIIMGHLHTYNVATEVNPVDVEDRHVAIYAPCLTEFNPDFMRQRPHQWVQGFVYGFVEPNGTFHNTIVLITDGRFVANGKLYGR